MYTKFLKKGTYRSHVGESLVLNRTRVLGDGVFFWWESGFLIKFVDDGRDA